MTPSRISPRELFELVHEMSCPMRLEKRKSALRRLRRQHQTEQGEWILGDTMAAIYQSLEAFCRYPLWRLLPYGCYVDEDGSYVLFDRDYCPIIRIYRDQQPEIVNPEKWIDKVDHRFFYEDSTAPNMDPEIFPMILMIAAFCCLEAEMDYRWLISNHGRGSYKEWAKKWRDHCERG